MNNKGFTPHHFWRKNNKPTIFLTKKSGGGFTLLELVISLFIVTVAVSGAFVILQKVITSTTISESNLTASFLAQEGLEIVRNLRDRNWIKGLSWDNGLTDCTSGKYCEVDYDDVTPLIGVNEATLPRFLKIDNAGFYNYVSGKETKFKRKIYISVSANNLKIQVLVQWQDFGRNYEVSVKGELYKWY